MERGKPPGRGGRTKTPQFPNDLYALGPKGTSRPAEKTDSKRSAPSSSKPAPSTYSSSSSSSASDKRKLNVPSTSSGITSSKKQKLSGGSHSSREPSTSQDVGKNWENFAADIDPVDLVSAVLEAKDNDQTDKVVSLLCGAFKTLKSNRMRTDSTLCNGLLLIAKLHPLLFANEVVYSALCSILRKESTSSVYKSKVNIGNMVLIVNLLYQGFKDMKRWPEAFVKLYVEDSVGERLWVDNEHCKCFTDNMMASVHTRPSSAYDVEPGMRSDDIDENLREHLLKDKAPLHVFPRYKHCQDSIENIIVECIKEHVNRRQFDGVNKNVLKFLAAVCGITEVRDIVANKLEIWLQNPKLMKSAQELLMALCINCTSHTQQDVGIVSTIAKIRLKTKSLNAFYLNCVRELIPAHAKNLPVLVKQTVQNEMSTARNPNNMQMLQTLFQSEPEKCAEILAELFVEFLMNKEDNLRSLRTLLREIARVLRSDFNLAIFCRGLMSQTDPITRDHELRDKVFNSVIDLVTLCIFLCIAPYARSDRRDIQQIERMQKTIAHIQSDAIWWFHETAIRVYFPSHNDFIRGVHKVLFMDPPDQYHKIDMWPPEQDRLIFLKFATEVPLLQSTVIRLLIIGISKEYPFSPVEALDLVDQLIRRAAALNLTIPVLTADKAEIADLLFNLSIYHHPENIDLPRGYIPPQLAISNLYWKSWIILLIYCAHVPTVFGTLAWDRYPMLRIFIEMCITNHFVYPTTADDLQIQQIEKQKILEFESHLAAASTKVIITEQNSLLLSQLISLDPSGPPRRPPSLVLEQIQILNHSHKLGHLLCRSRNPDFLLDIIQKQGTSQSMPWLADLVENSDGAFNHLPVQCLCEFLLSSDEKEGKYQELVAHLQNLLTDPTKDPTLVCEILDYFLRRLSSHSNKEQAIVGLRLLLNSIEEGEHKKCSKSVSYGDQSLWILNKLPYIPHFRYSRYQIVRALREACQVENDPDLVTSYLTFLAHHAVGSDVELSEIAELAADMAQLTVERSTIMSAVLFSILEDNKAENVAYNALLKIFYSFLTEAFQSKSDEYFWSEGQEQVIVTWPSGERLILYTLVIHAVIMLLALGPGSARNMPRYNHLFEMWFPTDRRLMPRGYLLETSQEALMMPDWLKLKMIRSAIPRMVEEALSELEPSQLILFIQSFGVPVESVSKLFCKLDHAASTHKTSIMAEMVLDKAYIIQLIEVQRRRGAVGGEIFENMVKSCSNVIQPVLEHEISISDEIEMKLTLEEKLTDHLSAEEIECLIDSLHTSVSHGQESKMIRDHRQLLLQILSMELMNSRTSARYQTPVLEILFTRLMHRCNSDPEFVFGILRNFHYPCRLFRMLITATNRDHINAVQVIGTAIVEHANTLSLTKNPLVVLINTFLTKTGYTFGTIDKKPKVDPDRDPVEMLKNCSLEHVQEASTKLLESASIKTGSAKPLIESLIQLMQTEETQSNSGLYIDLMVQMEPEIIGSSIDLQVEMLFSRDCKWKLVQQCRPYLLTLLTHHASWETLETAVVTLLTMDGTTRYEPKSVLDFLWALACNPKLWQGREKSTPKHGQNESVLSLKEQQFVSIAEYIILETELSTNDTEILDNMNNRLSQTIERALSPRHVRITKAILNHLNQFVNSRNEKRKTACRHLITQLYLRVPSVVTRLYGNLPRQNRFLEFTVHEEGSSLMDTVSHSLLTSITTDVHERGWVQRSQPLELLIRKMAVTHPLLLLRQLHIIQVSLAGRMHLEWRAFRYQNYFSLFSMMFNILEILKPRLFLPEFSPPFHGILDNYFAMFQSYKNEREIGGMVNRFISFVQSYVNYDSHRAMEYLQSQSAVLRELSGVFPSLGGLCVVMPSDEKEVLVTSTWSSMETSPAQFNALVNSLRYNDVNTALKDLERNTLRKPSILPYLLEHLFPLMRHSSNVIRSTVYNLLLRCAKYDSSSVERILPVAYNCLLSEDPEIVTSALEALPEFIACNQENAIPVMRKLFSLCVTSSINALPCITKTVSLLHLQSNC